MDQHALLAENSRLQLQNMKQELQSQLSQQQQQMMMMMPTGMAHVPHKQLPSRRGADVIFRS